jgi:hypothetical protein
MQPQIKQSKMTEEKPRNANLGDVKTSEGMPYNPKSSNQRWPKRSHAMPILAMQRHLKRCHTTPNQAIKDGRREATQYQSWRCKDI